MEFKSLVPFGRSVGLSRAETDVDPFRAFREKSIAYSTTLIERGGSRPRLQEIEMDFSHRGSMSPRRKKVWR